jgi:hypothetical protein
MAKRAHKSQRAKRSAVTSRRVAPRCGGTVVIDFGPPLGPGVVVSVPKGKPEFTLKEFAKSQIYVSDYVECIKRAVEAIRGTKRFPVVSWLMCRGTVSSPFGGKVPAGRMSFSLKDGSIVVVTVAPPKAPRHKTAVIWVSEAKEVSRA